MSIRRLATVQTGLLLAAMFANAASQKDTVRITVLDSVTRASTAENNNGVPQNCEQLTYDAYCRSTTNVPMISTLLVQEGNEPPFRIRCTIESRYSRCIPLPMGESFDARKDKRGLTVYYVDDKGKERRQLYTLVDAGGKASPPAAAAAVAAQPVAAAAARRQSSASSVPAQPTPAPPAPASPVPASPGAAPSVGSVQTAAPSEKVEKVRCNFSSTPPGAEITLDGKYVGSTPSKIDLATGTHVVVFSMPGFGQWKRELTVLSGSELNVSAILQKETP
jgi:PEGA domain